MERKDWNIELIESIIAKDVTRAKNALKNGAEAKLDYAELSVHNNVPEIFDILIDINPELLEFHQQFFKFAKTKESYPVIKKLINLGYISHVNPVETILLIVESGDVETLKKSINIRNDLIKKPNEVWITAFKSSNGPMFNFICEQNLQIKLNNAYIESLNNTYIESLNIEFLEALKKNGYELKFNDNSDNSLSTKLLSKFVRNNDLNSLEVYFTLPNNDKNVNQYQYFIQAITKGFSEIVKSFIKNKVKFNASQGNALSAAINNNQFEIVKILVEEKVQVDELNYYHLIEAGKKGYTDILFYLYENCSNKKEALKILNDPEKEVLQIAQIINLYVLQQELNKNLENKKTTKKKIKV